MKDWTQYGPTLVTGSNGFVGTALSRRIEQTGGKVLRVQRSAGGAAGFSDVHVVPSIDGLTDWHTVLRGCANVVHLAARVHMLDDPAADPIVEYRRVNTAGTLRLAEQAAQAGVRRFVFLSSVKVNGEGRETPYRADEPPAPGDPYGQSKWEAEMGLASIGARSGMEVVIIRPPLVYGPGVRANFLRLLGAVSRGMPLPLGAIRNRRSIVYVENLVDFVMTCVTNPHAAGRTFMIADDEDVSTPELIERIGNAMGRPARLVPVPPALLRAVGRLCGKSPQVERLLGSLTVDTAPAHGELGWHAPYSLSDGLAATASWYIRHCVK
ncbi:UDP-glucose 4-epimerase [Burkholderia multivorans]